MLVEKAESLRLEYQHARLSYKQEKTILAQAKQKVLDAEEAQQVLQAVAQTLQQSAHERIARIVTQCLKTVFGEDAYEFKIDFKRARGKTEARLVFVRDGLELQDPLNEASGGVVQVAAFALRLADLIISKPARRKVLFLDEPFGGLHYEAADRVRGLLLGLAKEMKVQLVFTTHNSQLRCGSVIELE